MTLMVVSHRSSVVGHGSWTVKDLAEASDPIVLDPNVGLRVVTDDVPRWPTFDQRLTTFHDARQSTHDLRRSTTHDA